MMISRTRITAVVVVSVLFGDLVAGDPNKSLVKRVCSLRHYQSDGGYSNCRHYVANEILDMTAKHGYHYSSDGRSGGEFSGTCYGHGACYGELLPDDCNSCLDHAWSYLRDYCTTSVGAQVKFQDCRIRFEDYPFDPNY